MKTRDKVLSKLKRLIDHNQFILYLGVFFIAFFTYLWIQATPSFLDPDSFYHLKISKLIAEQGPVIDFPWMQFTVLKQYYIDHHFLYHVLAIPFIKLLGDFIGFKFYTVILCALFILSAYVFFKQEKIKYAEFFTLLLIFSPAFMFRLSLAKATAFSLILLFWGIYCIFRKKYLLLFLISYFYVWSYGGFLLLLAMVANFILARAIGESFSASHFKMAGGRIIKTVNFIAFKLKVFIKAVFAPEHFKLVFVSLAGVVLGVILNPYFPKNLNFIWQQLVQIGLINYQGTVNVGGEWYPYKIMNLLSEGGLVIVFAVISLFLFVLSYKRQKSQSIFFLLSSSVFLILTLKSKRYVEYFIPHLAFFAAFTLNYFFEKINLRDIYKKIVKVAFSMKYLVNLMAAYLLIIALVMMAKDGYSTRLSFKGGIEFDRFKGISTYLLENSRPGEIIMQTDWDDWPMLFYYNHLNYYIVGLDPTFMYNYDRNLYQLFADITTTRKKDNLYGEIKEKFNASYFIVDEDREQLAKNLQNDGKFIKVYEDKDGSIYKLE